MEFEEIIKVKQYTCLRCSYKWLPRKEVRSIICPNCKTPYWNKPRRETVKKVEEKPENNTEKSKEKNNVCTEHTHI